MDKNIKEIHDKLLSGFFGFWVKKWKFTFLIIFLVIVTGVFSVITIPKESNPEIEYGIINITTIYAWVSPKDIDNLLTEKIESEIKDIDWIKKINSTSSVWVSNIIVEFENDADLTQALVDIKDAVDKTQIPSDAEDPIVSKISSDNQRMFVVLLYADEKKFDPIYLVERARKIKADLDGKEKINRIDLWGEVDMSKISVGTTNESDYEIDIQFDKTKLESIWLSLLQVSQIIKKRNFDQPLGNHQVGDYSYDFRISGELKNITELWEIPIKTTNWIIYIKDIATITKKLKDDSIKKLWSYLLSGQNYTILNFNKNDGENLFSSAENAKKQLAEELKKQEFEWLHYIITADLSEFIQEDNSKLIKNGLQTLILVFVALLFFIGFKESLIATITLPLAFFITFVVLKQLWLSLNFLTNFSLIITFGIAIDTTIVIIEWAHEKLRQWFWPKHAILLAVKDYKAPLIAGTSTTLVVFLPLLTLPGVMWKFLAYIPITIFSTLSAALIISLTLNSALYFKLSKSNKFYDSSILDEKYMAEEDRILLQSDRFWKKDKSGLKKEEKKTNLNKLKHFREKILDTVANKYSLVLEKIMKSKRSRSFSIIISITLFVVNIVILVPIIWFSLMPSGDNGFMTISVTAKKWISEDLFYPKIVSIENELSKIPEIKVYNYEIKDNIVNVNIELLRPHIRKKLKMRDTDELEWIINQQLDYFRSEWLELVVSVVKKWPPAGSAIWLKLIADNNDKFETLLLVAKDFEEYLQNVPWIKNTWISSEESPWQFVFQFNKPKLAILWLTPSDLTFELFAVTNWINAGTMKGKYDDHDIQVSYKSTEDFLSPTDVENIRVTTRIGAVDMWNVSSYEFESNISKLQREDTKILVTVDGSLEQGVTSNKIQEDFETFAKNYEYPDGIHYNSGWEAEENADLIQAMWSAFVIALLLIFAILVLQFNSFSQPVIIMFSILMWLFWANIWLRLTWNPYSLMFMIGFIALTWIVINDAIVFLDRANTNKKRWMNSFDAIVNAWKSRLHPILLTTITTIVGLSSILVDPMRQPLAVTIMFGIFFGSSMTLFVIPAIYYNVSELKNRKSAN